jgi:hypothetical protein
MKNRKELVLEHHGQRVRQLANFWGYDAYIDDEQQQQQRDPAEKRGAADYTHCAAEELT